MLIINVYQKWSIFVSSIHTCNVFSNSLILSYWILLYTYIHIMTMCKYFVYEQILIPAIFLYLFVCLIFTESYFRYFKDSQWTFIIVGFIFRTVSIFGAFREVTNSGKIKSTRKNSRYTVCQLWPWPLTSKINRVHPLVIVKMSVNFDEEAHNGLLSIMFTRSKRDGHTHGRTEQQQRYYVPSATRCAGGVTTLLLTYF